MRRRWLAVAVAVGTAGVVAASYLGWTDGRAPRGRAHPTGDGAVIAALPTDRAEVDRLIRGFEAQVRVAPNVAAFDFLGDLYLTRGRLTGDLTAYTQAAAAAERALAIAPRHEDARAVLARTSLALHDFSRARTLASEIVGDDPSRLDLVAVGGDASLELGDVDAARVALEAVASRAPGAASVTARLARLAYVTGDAAQAAALAARAETEAASAGATGSVLSFYPALRGSFAFAVGRYDEASACYERALRLAPGDRVALAGMARVRAAQGRTDDAISLYERAAALVPEPATMAALGDLYRIAGRDADARAAFATVEAVGRLQPAYGRAVANYLSDHRRHVGDAVDRALAELRAGRHDVFGHDAAAWALLAAGRVDDAVAEARRALRYDTPDPLLRYHAGMVFAAAGDRRAATRLLRSALALSPHFDPVQAPRARAELRRLEKGEA
jgi:tetratricopeptide (TPR) repeat protein